MAEPALKLVEETEAVETKALDIVGQAKAVTVTDVVTYEAAGLLWKQIGQMISEVKSTFDPICEAAHKAHKAATEKRAKFLDPLVAAQKSVKGLMSKWDEEQERIRLAEQRRLEEEARKRAEEEALIAAIEAEEEAKRNGATAEEAAAVAEMVMYEPVPIAPVVVPKATPKLAGGPVYQYRWSARVTSIRKLCGAVVGGASEELVMGLAKNAQGDITSPSLNQMAVALKDTMKIAGVEAVQRRV